MTMPTTSVLPNTEEAKAPAKGSLGVIFLTVFIDLLGFGMVLPLLPLYGKSLAESGGFDQWTTGWMLGLLTCSFSAAQFVCAPIWGRLSDRVGRRPVLLMGLTGSVIFYAIFGISAAFGSLWGLFFSRIGAGVAGATISTAQAYIADSTTPKGRAKGMALVGAAFALGFTLGPLLGSAALLLGPAAARSPWPGFVASGLSAIALFLAWRRLPESRTLSNQNQRLNASKGGMLAGMSPSVLAFIGTAFASVLAFSQFESSLSLVIDKIVQIDSQLTEIPQEASRVLAWFDPDQRMRSVDNRRSVVVLGVFVYLGLVLTLAQGFLVRRLAGRVSERMMATTGWIFAIVGLIAIGWTSRQGNFDLFLVAIAIEVIGFACVTPSVQSLISRGSDPEHQGAVLGVMQSATAVARILGPLVAMPLVAFQIDWPAWSAALFSAVGLLLFLLAVRKGGDWKVSQQPSE
ncbi:MAG: MFS transporter [Planctomycetota bacterium]|nr:MAG: MFS transporter [Planctomycetota bacterium]RLS97519.1 MAG: MFS transporter [Planctomycetota bacterium]TSA04353.1 MAG: MFS transporter [Planctomycetaceae bacterium]